MAVPDLDALPARVPGSKLVNVIVETPRGTRNKYKYDEERGLLFLHKRLPLGAAFPFDFGWVPGTLAEDGDALDVVLLVDEPTFSGCLVTTRLLGVIEAEQTEKKGEKLRNDRLVGVPETDKIRPRARTLGDLETEVLDQIEHFFVSYNRAEGRTFTPLARRGPAVAARKVDEAIAAWRAKRRPGGQRAQ